MKKVLILLLALAGVACRELHETEALPGRMIIQLKNEDVFIPGTKAGMDTGEYLLTVIGSGGEVIYNGRYKDSPEIIEVPEGNYTVGAVSAEFTEPGYDAPQYGDLQVVSVGAGKTISVLLSCVQLNAGLKMGASAEFRTLFPSAVFYLDSVEGRLMYTYGENRTAYFVPGKVSATMVCGGAEQTLFTRSLEARQVLAVGLTAATAAAGGIGLQIDTTRNWSNEEIMYGQGDSPVDVPTAREMGEQQDVWVYGYIVGSFSSNSKCEFEPPFSKNTNIVIAARTSVQDKSQCISVELKQGELRNSLNLIDNPENLGRKVWIRGDLVTAYYGIPGLKNITESRF